ncbi:MAG: hypothetical protein FJ222_07180 [Lentisphaerae bacterium]|nr:hypothetical protein [Lentisphaerota bacterium]
MNDPIAEAILAKEDQALKELSELFHEDGYFTRIKKMINGFGCPRDSREFKSARIEAQRLAAPACAVMIPLVSVILLAVLATGKISNTYEVQVEILETQEVPELKKEDLVEPEPVETDIHIDTDVTVPIDTPVATTTEPITQQPTPVDSVLQVKSPVIMRNIYGSRNPGMAGQLRKRFGGDDNTEAAVMAALRWLKKNQNADGSWNKVKPAMTALALLSFLSHGERPGADYPEFGETVRKALDYLIKTQKPNGRFTNSDDHEYALPMVAYALCEAYGMTMNPEVKEAAGKAIQVLISGQNPSGGWDYNVKPSERNDTSYMGWCAQALKAAHLSKAYADTQALEAAIKKAIKGFQSNYASGGGFGYTAPGTGGLSAIGVLSLQLIGSGKGPEVRSTLTLMEPWIPAITDKDFPKDVKRLGGSIQYYYYYATQAKFHEGGKQWESWNARMKPDYLKALIIEKGVYTDHLGKLQDIGHWVNDDNHTDRPVMDTCLAALQLMVYYRNLPTTQAAAIMDELGITTADAADPKSATGDIAVNVGDL